MDLLTTVSSVLASPDTYGAYNVRRLAPDGTIRNYSCSWAQGFGFRLHRWEYIKQFGPDLPKWVSSIHPAKAGRIFEVAAEGPLELAFDHDNLSSDDVPCPAEYAGHKGAVNKEQVLRFEPHRILAFTFGEGRNGVATFELFPEGDHTRLVLTHSGIQSPTGTQDFGSGWNSHLFVLQEKLAGRTVRDFWAVHAESRELVEQALA
ncbi:MAG: SRPBCC domain-containing protein [Sphingomicrobium sp.]